VNIQAALIATIQENKIVLLTGAAGSGKTETFYQIHGKLKNNDDYIVAVSCTLEKEKVTLSTLMDALFWDILNVEKPKIPRKDREQKLLALMEEAGKPVVLFVDDAHCLPRQTFSDLKKFHQRMCGSGVSFSVVLLGRPELQRRLRGDTIAKIEMTEPKNRSSAKQGFIFALARTKKGRIWRCSVIRWWIT
jgi:type II secretory pathway predicted ATPase ExeA